MIRESISFITQKQATTKHAAGQQKRYQQGKQSEILLFHPHLTYGWDKAGKNGHSAIVLAIDQSQPYILSTCVIIPFKVSAEFPGCLETHLTVFRYLTGIEGLRAPKVDSTTAFASGRKTLTNLTPGLGTLYALQNADQLFPTNEDKSQ